MHFEQIIRRHTVINSECHEWNGIANSDGYGIFWTLFSRWDPTFLKFGEQFQNCFLKLTVIAMHTSSNAQAPVFFVP